MNFNTEIPKEDVIPEDKGLFSFGEISTKLFYPLCMGLSDLIITIGQAMINKTVINAQGEKVSFVKHHFIYNWIMYLGECLIFILYVIERKGEKQTKTFKIKKLITIFGLICFCFICDFIASTICTLLNETDNTSFFELILKLISTSFVTFLCVIILHYNTIFIIL